MIIMYLRSDAGSILGGWVSSKLSQTGHSVNFARKVTMIGAGLCVLPLLFVTGLENMWLAVVLIGIALAGHQAFSSTILSIPPDMFPKRAVGSVIGLRSEEHTSELQSLMRISYAVFCLKKKQYTKK